MKIVKLNETCVFLQLSLCRMGDKRGVSSDDIEVDADKDLVKVRKVIFKSAAFDKIKSLDSEVRRYIRSQCFPFESGLHLMPLTMVDVITENLNRYLALRHEYVLEFVEAFREIKATFPDRLRKLYNEKDYDLGDVSSQFSMGWQFYCLEVPPTLEQVSSSMFKEEKRKFEARMQEAYEEARMILRETCLKLVTHLKTSLESDPYGAPKRLSTSTVTHLNEFLNNFDLRNVTNDQELQDLVKQIKFVAGGIDAESFRTIDGLRLSVRAELSSIEEKLQEAVTVQPLRRIKGV